MKFHVAAYALSALVLAACTSNAGTGGTAQQSGMLPAGSASAQYTIVNLGSLGGSSSGANSINNRKWASGFSTLASGTYQHAALWKNGSPAIDLGTLGGPNSAVEWPVNNARGLISGISETSASQKLGEVWSCALGFFPQPPSGHICRGFAWENGKMVKLGTLGGNNGFAAGANNRGEIVGWAETPKHDSTCTSPQVLQFEAVLYDSKHYHVTELRPMHGDKDGAATEINDLDQIVGISGICDQAVGRFTATHAVIWQHGRVINLGTLGGIAWNTPMALNNSGEVVGFSDLAGDTSGNPNFHAFYWTTGSGMVDMGTLSGDAYSEALGINASGEIVGASYGTGFSTSRAFVTVNGTMTDLNSLIPPSPQLYLLYANDVNNAGVIAGGACVLVSNACSSQSTAFMAIPTGNAASPRRQANTRPVSLPPMLARLIRQRALAL